MLEWIAAFMGAGAFNVAVIGMIWKAEQKEKTKSGNA